MQQQEDTEEAMLDENDMLQPLSQQHTEGDY